jgi:MFS family permease
VTIPISALGNIAISAPSQVASPKLVHDAYGAGAWLLGLLIVANSTGSVVAMFLVGQLHLRRRGLLAFLALVVLSFVMIVFGLRLPHSWEPVVATTAAFIGGASLGFFSIIWVTVLQEMVPDDKLGRVSSIDMLGSYALLPLGYALAGVLTDWIGPSLVFIAGGLLNLVLCLVALSRRAVRDLQ